MKKVHWFIVILIALFTAGSVSAQDLQATNQALELEINILKLQATKQALEAEMGQQNEPQPSEPIENASGGMMNWGSQNSPYVPTPTPFNNISVPISQQNFPALVRPPIPQGPPPTWDKPRTNRITRIYVGNSGQFRTMAEALKNIPDKAGEVIIYLTSDTEEPDDGFGIPVDKEITVVRIASDTGAKRTAWPADRSFWFFCNGVPLIIEPEVEFAEKSMIMGGALTYARHNVQTPKSVIIVNGSAWWVYAGGQSDREGHSSTVDNALVIINGNVDRVHAGGRAIYGETIVNRATVVVNGKANEVYCSGYTENLSAKTTVGNANMLIYGWYGIYGLARGQGQAYLLNPAGCY